MNIFISWSGERSRLLAEALADFLPDAIQDLNPWMSHDLSPGIRWGHALHQQLEATNFGILCLTPENINAPWLLFEAGSLAKNVSDSRVVPYRLNLGAADVPLPLAQFQGVDATQTGTEKLLESANALREQPLDTARLGRAFARCWPDLQKRIQAIAVPADETRHFVGERPGDVFWLGHDLARAIRLAMFELERRDELETELRQALFHLKQVGLGAPDAGRLLLKAIRATERGEIVSDADRKELVNAVAKAKNAIGDSIARLQSGFRGYPTIEELEKLRREIDEL